MASLSPIGRGLADQLAVGLSGLCIAHCLMLPLLMTFYSSSLLLIVGDEIFHKMIVLIATPVSGLALFTGCNRHRNSLVPALGISGLIVLIASATFVHDVWGELAEAVATVIGSLTLAASHVFNFRLCTRATDCSCNE